MFGEAVLWVPSIAGGVTALVVYLISLALIERRRIRLRSANLRSRLLR